MNEDNNLQISDIEKKQFYKKKGLIIASLICIACLVLGLILIPKGVKIIQKATHPILPEEIKFDMTINEYYNLDEKIKERYSSSDKLADQNYNNFENEYNDVPCSDSINYKLFSKINSKYKLFLSFDCNQKLYQVFVEIYHDDDFDKNWKYICNYYKAAFGKKYTESDWGSLMFSDLDIPETVVIDMSGETSDIWIQILSSEYEKETHEVSSASITSAFNSITYKYDGTNFGMNLKKLLDLCVENQKVYYDKLLPSDLTDYPALKETFKNKNSEYYKYASTSYIVTAHGDISEIAGYPMVDNDVDAVNVLLVFDEYDKLKAYKIIKEHKNLGTYFASYTFW